MEVCRRLGASRSDRGLELIVNSDFESILGTQIDELRPKERTLRHFATNFVHGVVEGFCNHTADIHCRVIFCQTFIEMLGYVPANYIRRWPHGAQHMIVSI